jgi:Zn-dependent protease with chaperone function
VYPATLSGDDFRHPLDQQNTALLRALPGLELVARNMMGPVAEQILLLENISTSIKAGPRQLPTLHALMTEAAEILRMDAPELYVRQNPVPNAYTLAIAGRKPFVVVHTALIELLTPAELQAVFAHELGHLKCDHGVWLTAANVLALGTVSLLPVISGAVEDNLWRCVPHVTSLSFEIIA